MNVKKKIQGFFSLTRRANAGFTLVELIVVIAILAILAGVAIPVYSGYIKKANMQADITLISEVKQALELYAYSNPGVSSAYVILGQEGAAPKYDDAGVGAAAMEAIFGAGYNSVGLKYAEWKGESSTLSYKDSNYYGNESSLINTVDSLTSALGKVVAEQRADGNDLMGTKFTEFLEDKGVDVNSEKGVGNAAVLYVAENTASVDPNVIQNAFATGINNAMASGDSGRIAEAVFTQLQSKLGNVGAMAAIYAYAEGYAQYSGQADAFHAGNDKFNNVTDTTSAISALAASFKSLENPADASKSFANYVTDGSGQKDLQAYIDMMNTVNSNQNMVSGNLEADDCFTDGTVENMLKGHAAMSSLSVATSDGEVAVVLVVDENGMVQTHVTPMNWNK